MLAKLNKTKSNLRRFSFSGSGSSGPEPMKLKASIPMEWVQITPSTSKNSFYITTILKTSNPLSPKGNIYE